jgi:uncharacterized protein (TIGR02147 family)
MNDYRLVLRQWLDERKARNARFSLRAFSQKIGISHSTLSQIFKGERNLSVQTAERIASHLKISADDKELFILKVKLESSTQEEAKDLLFKITEIERFRSIGQLTVDSTNVLSDWLSFAVYSISKFNLKNSSAGDIAQMLEVPLASVQQTLAKLISTGLLREDGNGYQTGERKSFNLESISEVLLLHIEFLKRHSEAFKRDNPERFISWADPVQIHHSQFKEVEELTKEYARKIFGLRVKAQQGGFPADELYMLSIAFSNLLPSRWKP